jgi:membrane fusion protein (multidrug efflux system)
MKSIIKKIILFLVLALLVVLIGWQLNKNKSKMEANSEIANQKMTVFPVTVISPNKEVLNQNFSVSGEFEPMHELNFVSESAGRVTSLKVENGDRVKKGQVIAQLDNEQTRIDLKLAEANLEKSKKDLEKFTTMAEGNAVSKQQVEEIKLAVVNAETRVETLKRQLKLSSINSPIAGTINGLTLEIGSYLAPGTMIAQITDVDKLKMTVSLLDHEVIMISDNQKINIVADLYPASPLEGKVSFISPKADGSGKYLVEIEFTNPGKDYQLKAGMTGRANFEFAGSAEKTLIPVKCLVGSTQDPVVFVVNGDIVQTRKIHVGTIYGDKIEVISGLEFSDKIVSTGLSNLSEGSKIQIIE